MTSALNLKCFFSHCFRSDTHRPKNTVPYPCSMASALPPNSTSLMGVCIAVLSSFINGSTCVLQKKGILRAREKGTSYLRDVVWWSGTLATIVGQIGNFVAYNFAPAVLVTPLGALGLLFGAALASLVLKEPLNILGKLACLLCCCGSAILVIHAPKSDNVTSRPDLEDRLVDPVVLVFLVSVVLVLVALIVWLAPLYGSSNIMVYASICSLIGSFTVPCCKGLGLAAPDAFNRSSPDSNRAMALFAGLLVSLVISIVIQFIFINRALEKFSSHMFEAIYCVTFTSTVIFASAVLFREWTSINVVDCLGMVCGLVTMSVGVTLLLISHDALLTWTPKKLTKKDD